MLLKFQHKPCCSASFNWPPHRHFNIMLHDEILPQHSLLRVKTVLWYNTKKLFHFKFSQLNHICTSRLIEYVFKETGTSCQEMKLTSNKAIASQCVLPPRSTNGLDQPNCKGNSDKMIGAGGECNEFELASTVPSISSPEPACFRPVVTKHATLWTK